MARYKGNTPEEQRSNKIKHRVGKYGSLAGAAVVGASLPIKSKAASKSLAHRAGFMMTEASKEQSPFWKWAERRTGRSQGKRAKAIMQGPRLTKGINREVGPKTYYGAKVGVAALGVGGALYARHRYIERKGHYEKSYTRRARVGKGRKRIVQQKVRRKR